MVASAEKQVVFPDLHGRYDLLRAGLAKYKNFQPIFLGDYINGQPFERDVIGAVRDNYDPQLGNAVLGNHEMTLLTVLQAALSIESDKGDVEVAHTVIDLWSKSRAIGYSMLRSYGVNMRLYRQPQARLLRLYERMQETGDVDFLSQLPLMFEGRDMVAVHAGLTDESLTDQVQQLEVAKKQLLAGEVGIEPAQVYSHDLSRVRGAYAATDSVVVTGHTSFNEDETTRISDDGRHVRLGSNVKRESETTIFLYLTDQAKVVPVEAS